MNNSLENLLATQSFVLWIKGECSPTEKKYWDLWLGESPEHRKLARQAREIMGAVNSEYDIPDPQGELKKLDRQIDRYENRGNNSNFFYAQNSPWRQYAGGIAAGLLFLVVLLGSIFIYQQYPADKSKSNVVKSEAGFAKEYHTGYGEKVTFRLSDGSEIILNANSHLRFSSKIKEGLNTEVWLQGEAYFDIAHLGGGQQRTFTVHTADGSIQVMGTRFSVNTFGDDTQTALERGKISIRIRDADKGLSSTEYALNPGEMAQFTSNDNKITVKEADTRMYTSWTEDKLFFRHTPIQVVARRIERTFGVRVVMGQQFMNERLTGTIRSDSLEVLAKALTKVLDTNVTNSGGTLHIGTED